VPQLIACPKNSKLAQACHAQDLNFIPLTSQGSISITNAWRLKSACKQHQINIIHAHDAHALTTAVLSSMLFGNHAAIIASRRVNYPITGALSKFKYNYKRVKKILCVSKAVYDVVAPVIKNKNRLTTVHSGIDLNKFNLNQPTQLLRTEYQIPADELLIGNAAALTEQKDYPTFINTAKILVDQGIKAKFIIIGDGPLHAQLQQQVSQLALNEQIIFAGFRTNIPELLPEFDILLSTSINEGLGTTILEAMTAKVSVVATQAGGVGEMIAHEVTGMLVPSASPEQLARCCQQLINHPVSRQKLTENAYKKVQQFDKAITARKTLEIYLNL